MLSCYRIVNLSTIDHITLEEVLGGEVEQHIDCRNQILVPQQIFGKEVAEECGRGGEYAVVTHHFQHCRGDIGGRFECEFAVEREVLQYRQEQRGQIAGVVLPIGQFVQKGE